jgi:hypothetical protein
MGTKVRKMHRRDNNFTDKALCGAKNPGLSDEWTAVTCGNCLSWKSHSEKRDPGVVRHAEG